MALFLTLQAVLNKWVKFAISIIISYLYHRISHHSWCNTVTSIIKRFRKLIFLILIEP